MILLRACHLTVTTKISLRTAATVVRSLRCFTTFCISFHFEGKSTVELFDDFFNSISSLIFYNSMILVESLWIPISIILTIKSRLKTTLSHIYNPITYRVTEIFQDIISSRSPHLHAVIIFFLPSLILAYHAIHWDKFIPAADLSKICFLPE